MLRSKLLCSTLIVAASVGGAGTAAAQSAGASVAQLEEVVVTARKREESLQSVPVAVTAATGATLQQQRILSPLDLPRITPSLTAVSGSANPSGVAYSLRGQTGGSFQINQSSPVAVYQDGVNIAHAGGQGAGFVDVTRVEVLNGPQGTLYGRNSTGGAINTITRDADHNGLHGFGELELGDYEDQKVTGAINVPIIKDVLAARLVGQHWYRKGFGRSAITGQDLGEDRNDTDLRLSVTYDPMTTLRIKAKAEWIDLDRNGELNLTRYTDARYPANVLPAIQSMGLEGYPINAFNNRQNPGNPTAAPGVNTQYQARLDAGTAGANLLAPYLASASRDLFTNFTSTVTYDKVTTYFGALDISWDVTDTVRLRSLTGYRNFVEYRIFDNDGLPWHLAENSWGAAAAGPAGVQGACAHGTSVGAPTNCFDPPFANEPYNASEFYSQEFNLSGTFMDKLDWLLGAYGSWDDMSTTQHPLSRIGTRTFNSANTASLSCSVQPATGQSCAAAGGVTITDPGGAGSAASTRPAVNASTASFPTTGFVSFDGDIEQTTWGIFTQNDLHLSDRVRLTFGLRYGEEKQTQEASFAAVAFIPPGTPAAFIPAGAQIGYNWLCLVGPAGQFKANESGCKVHQGGDAGKFSATAYTLSFNFQATPDVLFYAKTSRGFRGGSFNVSTPGAPPVGLEKATDYELGLKADLFDKRARANLALYQTKYDNKVESILNVVGGISQILTTNAAAATIHGFEGQFFATPFEGLTAYGTLTWLEGQYDDYPGAIIPGDSSVLPAAIVGRSQNGAGVEFPDPEWRYSIGARYSRDIGPGALSGQLDWAWRGEAKVTRLTRDPSIPTNILDEFNASRGLLNGNISYDIADQGLHMSIWATNLTNEEYQLAGVPASLFTGFGNGFTAPPRMWGVTVRKAFGAE